MKKNFLFLILNCIAFCSFAQNDKIAMDVFLNVKTKQLEINQTITYFNNSNTSLDTIHLLNWAHSFNGQNTPLTKRLIEDYDKSLYFAKKNERGHVKIDTIYSNSHQSSWNIPKQTPDIINLALTKSLPPNDSIKIKLRYKVKIPEDKFTQYGKKENTYNLRYWHITPAVFKNKWHKMSHLNLDDYYMTPTDYNIKLKLYEGIVLNTDLNESKKTTPPFSYYTLTGKNRVDLELNISISNDFKRFKTTKIEVVTNLNSLQLQDNVKKDVLNRQLNFIETHLGAYPHHKLLVNKISYDKNPIYGLNQLPKMFNPFSGVFEWDIKMFKALTRKYLENTLIINRRTDAWLLDGIQSYLMMQYVKEFYPEIKAMGTISRIWGVRSYSIAKLNFNDKYPFVYQFAARKNLDQALTTPADSLSTFNRKIVNKYKAGIGLQYLNEYLQNNIVPQSIKAFYNDNKLKKIQSNTFKKYIAAKTTKKINWFFDDYLQTKKKIDYTIKKIKKSKDSVTVFIENKRNFSAPVALYGVNKKKEVLFKKWIDPIDSIQIIKIPKGNYNRLALNYDYQYPELNLRNNWKNLTGIFNKPIQLRFFKDIENPFYNQAFFNATASYNYYDGVVIGPELYNKSLIRKKWLFHVSPSYGFKSQKLSGSASLVFQHLPENSKIYKLSIGIAGKTSQYAPELSYKKITPFASISFKRKSLRDIGGEVISARQIIVNKDPLPNNVNNTELNNYNIFNLRYASSDLNIIKGFSYATDFQASKKFSKLSLNVNYRKLTQANRQYDIRLFAGTFLHNKTTTNEFDFSLDRPTDYLFDYSYLGRSEQTGYLSQQIIIAEGGFKSIFKNNSASQWMVTSNGSIGIWRWIEAYADAGFYKSKGMKPQFKYDSGIRLNFITDFLEIYFPIQSSLGFEPTQFNYSSKIRFVLTISPGRIYNFIKRGFY